MFLTDAALLEMLARDKLAAIAESSRLDGWAWIEAVPRITSAELRGFPRDRCARRAQNKTEAKRIPSRWSQRSRPRSSLESLRKWRRL